jgi:hypothetical protein
VEDQVTIPSCITTSLKATGHLCVAALCLTFLLPSSTATAAGRTSDAFLTGYVASILERDLHWQRESYVLKIVDGVATIILFKDDPMRKEAVDRELRALDGLQGVTVVVKPQKDGNPEAVSSFIGI